MSGHISGLSVLVHRAIFLSHATFRQSWRLFLCNKFWSQEVFQFCSRVFWLFWVPCISMWILGSACQFLQKQKQKNKKKPLKPSMDFHNDCMKSIGQFEDYCHLKTFTSLSEYFRGKCSPFAKIVISPFLLKCHASSYTIIFLLSGDSFYCFYCLENPRDRGTWWAAVYGVDGFGHDWSDLAVAESL